MSKEINSIKSIKQLLLFPAYLKIINELQGRLSDLDEEIINTIWEWELKYTSLDLKRVERQIIQQFITLPENLLEEFDNIVIANDLDEEEI